MPAANQLGLHFVTWFVSQSASIQFPTHPADPHLRPILRTAKDFLQESAKLRCFDQFCGESYGKFILHLTHVTPRPSNLTELALPGFLKLLPGRLNATSKKRDLLPSSAVPLDKACSNCKRARASWNRTAARGPAILSFIGVLFRVHILLVHFVQKSVAWWCVAILCKRVSRNFSLNRALHYLSQFHCFFCGSESVVRLLCHDSFASLDLHGFHNVCKWFSMSSMFSCFNSRRLRFLMHHSLRLLTAESAPWKDTVRLQLGDKRLLQ